MSYLLRESTKFWALKFHFMNFSMFYSFNITCILNLKKLGLIYDAIKTIVRSLDEIASAIRWITH